MSLNLLSQIDSPKDLKQLKTNQLDLLCKEIRQVITEQVATQGGHLGASLGAVELAVAIHFCFDAPIDDVVWDVGHQAYAHKILTGRRASFKSIRQYKGLSGFPSHKESIYDPFSVGHSSTSISAILGIAKGKQLQQNHSFNIAVIGDGALTGGMAFEALNQISSLNSNTLIILNDNQMSIDPNVGALNQSFNDPQQAKSFFEALQIPYFGPIDGHQMDTLIEALDNYRTQKGPLLLHVKTHKGKGYQPAEEGDRTTWHAPGLFNYNTGKIEQKVSSSPKFQEVFGDSILALANQDEKVVAVSPAMISGASLNEMQQKFPDRVFDVGIAEQHAVTFAAGLAKSGLKVFCHLYATFSQRAMDQIIHDVALQELPMIIPMDRSGLVGADGATHHGLFDYAQLKSVPNTIISSAWNAQELKNLIFTAYQKQHKGPFIIRYPRGNVENPALLNNHENNILAIGQHELIQNGSSLLIISHGPLIQKIKHVLEEIPQDKKSQVTLINLRYLKPLDTNMLSKAIAAHQKLWVMEELYLNGSVFESIAAQVHIPDSIEVHTQHLSEQFIGHGPVESLLAEDHLDSPQIKSYLLRLLS